MPCPPVLPGALPGALHRANSPAPVRRRLVGALAAALLGLGPGLTPAQTPAAELDSVQRAVHVCASCHGPEGRSNHAFAPSLAGQMRDYTLRQLKDFRSQTRAETDTQAYMWGISALLTDEQITGLADYYAAQKPRPPRSTRPALEAAGRQLFEAGIPARGVRACAACHGDRAEGAAGFPRLAGLQSGYVLRQLQAFRGPLRPHGVIMKAEVQSLGAREMQALAAYLESL